jgi:hypothetical protein
MNRELSHTSWTVIIVAAIMVACTTGCGNLGVTTTGNSEAGASGGGSGGSTSSGKFTFKAKVPASSLATISAKGVTNGVTHVVARYVETGQEKCEVKAVESDGTVSMELESFRALLIGFGNALGQGSSMEIGTINVDGLTTVIANEDGSTIDAGEVTLDATTQTATVAKSRSEWESALNMDTETAAAVDAVDEGALRERNLDKDNDGTLDCLQDNRGFLLDLHIRSDLQMSSKDVTVDDLINYTVDTSTLGIEYSSTGIMFATPDTFSTTTTGTVTLPSAVTNLDGETIAADTASTNVDAYTFTGYSGIQLNMNNESELPKGTYVFGIDDQTITYSDVNPPTLAQMQSYENRLMPVLSITTNDSTCTSACTIEAIAVTWLKMTSSGLVTATAKELKNLIKADSPTLSLKYKVDADEIGFKIPYAAATSTIEWKASGATFTTSLEDAFATITTDDIACNPGISYDDMFGNRYFVSLKDGTSCASTTSSSTPVESSSDHSE